MRRCVKRCARPSGRSTFAAQAPIERAAEATLRACDGLRSAVGSPDGIRQAYRALRNVSRAQEALYPLAAVLPTVNRFFLAPARRDDQALRPAGCRRHARRCADRCDTCPNDTSERGGFSVYVPEDYDPTRYPLVMALHGGAGHGRLFLWSWLREARGRGVILVAPTAIGDTWSLMEPDVDSVHLAEVLEEIARRWVVDRTRLLLTGMSDGGTFTLLSGLDDAITIHSPGAGRGELSSVAADHGGAAAHDGAAGLSGARRARLDVPGIDRPDRATGTDGGGRAGDYREIADLSHAYPREEGSAILDWFLAED